MFFDFEGRNFDAPTIESAISWREQLLSSLFLHLAAALLVFFLPQLPFVQEATQRRVERLAEQAKVLELAEMQRQLPLQQSQDEAPFIFVAPRVAIEADEPPRSDALSSDQNRTAQSPLRTFDSESNLPIADGNSFEFVESDEASDELDLLAEIDRDLDDQERAQVDSAEAIEENDPRLAEATSGNEETDRSTDEPVDEPGGRPEENERPVASELADSSLTNPGFGPGDPDDSLDDREIEADGLLGQVRETLRRSVNERTFGNVSGDTGRYGPEIQFDTKGVEFGPWIRRFVAQIRRNWFIPYSVLSNRGHVVLTFNVHRNGSLTDLSVLQPSAIASFNQSASNALRLSNPTQPLPTEYPDETAFFTVTFYFNEIPPGRQRF